MRQWGMANSDEEMGTESYVPQGFYHLLRVLPLDALAEVRDHLGSMVPVDDRDIMMCESATSALAARRTRGDRT
jgi:hypothetical protein